MDQIVCTLAAIVVVAFIAVMVIGAVVALVKN